MTGSVQVSALAYAVRGRIVAKYLGQVGLVLAALTLVPLAVSLGFGELSTAIRYLTMIVLIAAAGTPLARLKAPEQLRPNEGLAISALAFLLAPALMTWPMMAAGLSPADAFFEAVSGVTTTGLTTLAHVGGRPAGFLFARAWLQWYGGLGIVVLSVALLSGHQSASRRLIDPESGAENLVATTRLHARRALVVYLVLTLIGILFVRLLGVPLFSAVLHVLAGISTGGFSPFDDSLRGLIPSARYAITVITLAGAVSLPLYYRLYTQGPKALAQDIELPALLIGVLVISALVALLLHREGAAWSHALGTGFLLGAAAHTTSGFSVTAVNQLGPAIKLLLIYAMLVGGSIGSTAGGVKILRSLVVLRLMGLAVRRTATPAHAVIKPHLGGRPLESEDIERSMLVIFLFAGVVILSWLPFVIAGYPALNALFEVVSATCTVGLSTGITHHQLPLLLKGVLCFDMLAGRLEIVALLVVLYPRTWIGKRAE